MFEKEAEDKAIEFANKQDFLEGEWIDKEFSYGKVIAVYEQGFQDGAEYGYNKANEWHSLRKNPEDLPKNSDDEKLYLIHWGENDYGVAQFNDSRWWSFDSGLFNDEEVIAWCELLEFIECRT